GGTLSSFSFDSASGRLDFLNLHPTWGTDPCYVELDKSGRWAAVANFMSGSIAIFPVLPDGSLGPAATRVQHEGSGPDPLRQKGPHAHSTIFSSDNKTLYVPDLGLDMVVAYDFDPASGSLAPKRGGSLRAPRGAGPRQVVFHPSSRFAYVVNELSSSVSAYDLEQSGDPRAGAGMGVDAGSSAAIDPAQTLSTLPEGLSGANSCADIKIHPTGAWLYASNRGQDSIAVFSIDRDSSLLRFEGVESTRGGVPRNFAIDPSGSWLVAANQDTDTLVLFSIDQGTGRLGYTGLSQAVPTPVCVVFA
ncbi:MAG: 3-carboxymuconate cyclase, partial [Spirochaetae bacterium HGW-Spirochaetae-9]